jgi:magnesium transporter
MHLRERIRSGAGIIRKKKNDYLLYVMLDAIIENFFITIEHYEDRIELLMVEAKNNHKAEFLEQIERLREETSFLKRNIIPLRDALYTLKEIREDDDAERISKSNYVFFARLHQKCLEIIEQLEYDNKTLESAANIFFSSQSQKMNQIMKTLTIFSVIFMPLTFIVGVYGMNFEHMPELKSVYGYPGVWLVMLFSVVAMVIYFRKKKWF